MLTKDQKKDLDALNKQARIIVNEANDVLSNGIPQFKREAEKIMEKLDNLNTELAAHMESMMDRANELYESAETFDNVQDVRLLCPACINHAGIAKGCSVCEFTGYIDNPQYEAQTNPERPPVIKGE